MVFLPCVNDSDTVRAAKAAEEEEEDEEEEKDEEEGEEEDYTEGLFGAALWICSVLHLLR